jgi:transposase
VQIGPNALALAAHLNKRAGMSYEKIQDFFSIAFSLSLSRSTLVRALLRLSEKARPTYEALVIRIREARAVYSDETGWKVGGFRRWLHVHVSVWSQVCVYRIGRGRGYAESMAVLGEFFSGLLGTDGWAPYDRFLHARRQTCLGHLLRRCHDLEEGLTRGAVRFPRALKALLQKALALRDRRDEGLISAHGLAVAKGRLEGALRRLVNGRFTNELNRKLARHVRKLETQLFTFLALPGVEATNWPAEQALRPAVVNRKMSAGNRTDRGARAQETLMSILHTCRLQGRDALKLFVHILRDPTPKPYRLVRVRSG